MMRPRGPTEEMSTVRIPAQSTIAASERALSELGEAPIKEALKLPTRVRHLAGGAEASLVQLIVTWAQRSRPRRLETFIASPEDEQIVDFVRRLTGLVAALCADEIAGVSRNVDLTRAVTTAALERLDQLSGSRPTSAYRGPSAEIICADHIGRGAPYLLYQRSAKGGFELRSRENFRALASWLLRRVIPAEYLETFDPMAGDAIGGMLYELLKNTEDHALVDDQGDLLSTSIRALKTNHIGIIPGELVRLVEDSAPIANYCRSLTAQAGGVQTHLFELSILDSGPGFAATWTGKPLENLSDTEEERAVRDCFGRGSTKRGSTKGESRFGEGLPHVMRMLRKERGFLRLRTGRISLFADYSRPDQPAEASALQRFRPDGNKLARVAGSLLTLIIPMSRRA
jgi:hypothetical protein